MDDAATPACGASRAATCTPKLRRRLELVSPRSCGIAPSLVASTPVTTDADAGEKDEERRRTYAHFSAALPLPPQRRRRSSTAAPNRPMATAPPTTMGTMGVEEPEERPVIAAWLLSTTTTASASSAVGGGSGEGPGGGGGGAEGGGGGGGDGGGGETEASCVVAMGAERTCTPRAALAATAVASDVCIDAKTASASATSTRNRRWTLAAVTSSETAEASTPRVVARPSARRNLAAAS